MEIQFQKGQEQEQEQLKVRKSRKRKAEGRSNNKYIGVRQRPSGRWVAEIKDTTQKIRMWLGTFESAEEAARAYDEAACLLRGANTRTNFITTTARLPSNSPLASRITNLLNTKKKHNNNNNNDIALIADDADHQKQQQQQQVSYNDNECEGRRIDDCSDKLFGGVDEDVYRPDLGGFSFFAQEDISSYSYPSMMLDNNTSNSSLEDEEEQQQQFQFQFERIRVERQISASLYAMNGLHQYMKEAHAHAVYDPADAALWDLPPLSPLLTFTSTIS